MSETAAILAIDQGTTSSRALVFDVEAEMVSFAQQEFPQHYPANGWVEHDPDDIWQTSLSVCRAALEQAEAKGARIAAIGITNQRETTIVWDRQTGMPVYPAIVWQDRRTADACAKLHEAGLEGTINEKTGLLLDPYFSATKIAWILDNVEGARSRATTGRLAFGTVDSFLIWHLTAGTVHATDATNACRTSLFNIERGCWDADLLKIFDIPISILPEVKDSNGGFGATDPAHFGRAIPIRGVAGDQQAATIGQACFETGDVKGTYGTGCFILSNTGKKRVHSKNRLLTTLAYQIDGKACYALEGSIFIAGAGVQWLRDSLQIIRSASETQSIAESLASNNGVYVVPAFTGLGAPYWKPTVRGAIFGLTRNSGRADLARAMIEAVCYQTHDLLAAIIDEGVACRSLKVDGGMAANDWMCTFLSGLLDLPVERPRIMETTALGAAYLAGMSSGIYGSLAEIQRQWRPANRFSPTMGVDDRVRNLDGWRRAVNATLAF